MRYKVDVSKFLDQFRLTEDNQEVIGTQKDKEALSSGEITLEAVIEKLNQLRSGKSLKNEVIFHNFKNYFDKLDDGEKTTLFVFLKSIGQILSGEVNSDQVLEPSDKPVSVKMDKEKHSTERQIKPNVIKTNIPQTKKEVPAEDSNSPIQVSR